MMIELSPADLAGPRIGHGATGDRRHTVHLGGHPSPITADMTAGEILGVAQAWNDLAAIAMEREHGSAATHDALAALTELVA